MPTRDQIAEKIDQYWTIIDRFAVVYGVRQSLIQAVIHQESGGDPRAYRAEPKINDASYGLMQLLYSTARGLDPAITKTKDLYDPEINIRLGTMYLSRLFKQYNSWKIALIGYNGGPRAVVNYLKTGKRGRAVRYAENVLELQQFYIRWNTAKGRAPKQSP